MVDEVITKQELIDAKRDARDLGKAVNEKVIVSPRYGEDFKSLPMVATEFQDAIEAAAAAGAGANGWTDLLIQTADGSTQRERNSSFQSQIDSKASSTYVDAQDASLQSQIDQKATADYLDNALTEQTQAVNTALSQLSTAATKFYPTLAEANADIVNIEVNQPVQIGEVANGGLWYKATAGATSLTKSPHDPLTQAKADATTKANAAEANAKLYADQKTKNIDSNVDNDTHQFTDEDFNIVARIDSDAQLHLVDLENSVQDEINKQKKAATHTSDIESLLHVFADDDDNIVAGIDKSGGLRLVGSTVSLQEKLNWRKVQLPARDFDERDLFVESANKYILNMSVSGNQNAPIPFNLIPQKYTVPDSIVNAFTLAPPTNYTPLTTPYGVNDKVVHPYVIEFAGNLRGYRYLMCITPYTAESHENPVIMGSNDLQEWEMLTGFDQPLATPSATTFLSDNGLAYDPINGMLICYWRTSDIGTSANSHLKYRATRNGIDWTEPVLLIDVDSTSLHLSPSILFNPNDGLWHLWIGQESGYWRHYTAKNLNNNWTLKSTTPFLEKGIWHSEVKFVGDKYVMLINKRDPDSNFYFAVSSNGDDWITGNYLFNIQQEALYKASFLPKFNDAGEMAFDIFYTTNHASDPTWIRKFFHLTTNFAEI